MIWNWKFCAGSSSSSLASLCVVRNCNQMRLEISRTSLRQSLKPWRLPRLSDTTCLNIQQESLEYTKNKWWQREWEREKSRQEEIHKITNAICELFFFFKSKNILKNFVKIKWQSFASTHKCTVQSLRARVCVNARMSRIRQLVARHCEKKTLADIGISNKTNR